MLYIFISLCLFELAFGQWGSFSCSKDIFPSKENHYSIGMFKEMSFEGNYVSDSLHLTLAMITYSYCRQPTNSEMCSVNET